MRTAVILSLIIGASSSVTWQSFSADTVCADVLGEQGAPDVTTCLSNCEVDPRCKYATFTPPSDCSWSTECVSTTTMPNATTFFKNSSSFPRGYYVSTIANLPADPLSVVTGIGVDQAVETCSKMSNCTAFVFDGPASDEIQSSVSFFNTEIALAPDRLFSLWVYIKNASVLPFCDASVSQHFLSAQQNNTLDIVWTHCAGANLTVQLHPPSSRGTPSFIASPNASSSLNISMTLGRIPLHQVGQDWLLTVTAGMDQHVLQSFPLLVVDLSCPSSGVWPASVAATNATLNCWDVDGDHFASGVAQRSCNPHGSWDAADLSACSTDWTQLELSMLAEAEAALSFVDHWLKNRFQLLGLFPWQQDLR